MKNVHKKQPAHQVPAPAHSIHTRLASAGIRLSLLITVVASFIVAACQDHQIPSFGPEAFPGHNIKSNNPKPVWGPTITQQNLAIIEELGRLNPDPLFTLLPQEARMRPSVKDAVNSLLAKNKIAPPPSNVTQTKRIIPGADNVPIEVAIFTPNNVSGKLPVIVYYHGGGWVIANSDVYEASTIALAQNTGSVVVSVNYRLGPENRFPTAHRDAYAAYKWVTEHMSDINGNGKVAVAGESAGGNMAVTTAMMARDSNIMKPLHILSVYPVANNNLDAPSYNIYGNAMPLSKTLVVYFISNYFKSLADGDSPLISLVDKANLSGLPPVTIIGAEIDPLQSDGMDLRDALTNAKVPVTYKLYEGVTHEFFGTYAIEPKAAEAQALAASQLINAFK